jgi:hypothetical protein
MIRHQDRISCMVRQFAHIDTPWSAHAHTTKVIGESLRHSILPNTETSNRCRSLGPISDDRALSETSWCCRRQMRTKDRRKVSLFVALCSNDVVCGFQENFRWPKRTEAPRVTLPARLASCNVLRFTSQTAWLLMPRDLETWLHFHSPRSTVNHTHRSTDIPSHRRLTSRAIAQGLLTRTRRARDLMRRGL